MDNDLRILKADEVNEKLKEFPGWNYNNDKISRQFELESFLKVIELINLLVPFFEKIDHHADMHIYYKKIVFDLQRFDVGGKVTERDFTVAGEIERLYGELAGK